MTKNECNHIDESGNKLTTVYKSPDDIECKQCKAKLTHDEFKQTVELVAKQYDANLKKKQAEQEKKGERQKYV